MTLLLVFALAGLPGVVRAWSNHALGTWQALSAMPEVTDAPEATAYTIDRFLAAQGTALEEVLEREEQWARARIPGYPARPDALAYRFDARLPPAELRRRFLAALRVNPRLPLALYLQRPPGPVRGTAAGRPTLPWQAVSTVGEGSSIPSHPFVSLREGDAVPVIDVLASACDEPDYGLDIGLFEDNGTDYGATYGFGKQPFGNPRVAFSSQAPFHMGYFHESGIVYSAAPFLRRTWPDWRAHLWHTLAVHAMRTGQHYWGWRFTGWALHYIQDLTQPYHARVLPGVSTPRMLWINLVDLAGWHTPKNDAITLVSNRHLALENFQRNGMLDALARNALTEPVLRAYADTRVDLMHPQLEDRDVRGRVALQSHEAADRTDAVLAASLPARYVSDPTVDFPPGPDGVNLYALLAKDAPAARDALNEGLAPLYRHFGAETRALIRTVLQAAKGGGTERR